MTAKIGEESAEMGVIAEMTAKIGGKSAEMGVIAEMTAKIRGGSAEMGVITEMTAKIGEESTEMGVITEMTAKIGEESAEMGVITEMTAKIREESTEMGVILVISMIWIFGVLKYIELIILAVITVVVLSPSGGNSVRKVASVIYSRSVCFAQIKQSYSLLRKVACFTQSRLIGGFCLIGHAAVIKC